MGFPVGRMVKFKINRIIDQLLDSYYTDRRFDVLFLFVAAFRASRDEHEKLEEIRRNAREEPPLWSLSTQQNMLLGVNIAREVTMECFQKTG